MLNLTRAELVKMGNDEKNIPIMDALIARGLAGKEGLKAMNEFIDRMHGKAKQVTDLTTGGEPIQPTSITVVHRIVRKEDME